MGKRGENTPPSISSLFLTHCEGTRPGERKKKNENRSGESDRNITTPMPLGANRHANTNLTTSLSGLQFVPSHTRQRGNTATFPHPGKVQQIQTLYSSQLFLDARVPSLAGWGKTLKKTKQPQRCPACVCVYLFVDEADIVIHPWGSPNKKLCLDWWQTEATASKCCCSLEQIWDRRTFSSAIIIFSTL